MERDQAALELGLGAEAMGAALARARRQLRRSRHALAGSGWCERAERLISDRLDGELAPFPAKRLDAHLRNCPRCVEHELRLTQATDELVEGMPAPAKPASRSCDWCCRGCRPCPPAGRREVLAGGRGARAETHRGAGPSRPPDARGRGGPQ